MLTGIFFLPKKQNVFFLTLGADFEVNLWALKEKTDGIFLSYTVVQGTPSVCDALAKSRNEFYQASQSHKVVLHRLPLKQEPRQNLLYSRVDHKIWQHFTQFSRASLLTFLLWS